MPKITIPKQDKKDWQISYLGDYYGDIIGNFCINLDNSYGRITTNGMLDYHTLMSRNELPTSFCKYSNWYWVATSLTGYGRLYITQSLGDSFGEAASFTNYGLVDPDMVSFANCLIVSERTNLAKYDGSWDYSWWSTTLSQGNFSFDSGNTTDPASHILTIFESSVPVLFISDGNYLHSITYSSSISSTDVKKNRLIFNQNLRINWMKATTDRLYIGLFNYSGGNTSYIAEYDPINENVRMFTITEGKTIGFIYNNYLYIITEKGSIKLLNGSYFEDLQNGYFPNYFSNSYLILPHRNGIVVDNNKFYFLIPHLNSPSSLDSYYLNGGIYEYDLITQKLYHAIPVFYTNSSYNYTNYGTWIGESGFLIKLDAFYCGLSVVPTYSSNQIYGIWQYPRTNPRYLYKTRGYFLTAKILSPEINSIFRQILLKTKNSFSNNEIVVKYRIDDKNNSDFIGTWDTGGMSFTILGTLLTQYGYGKGDEIYITRGQGSGTSAHIVNITSVSGGLRVYLDEAFNVYSNIDMNFIFTVSKFKKIGKNILGQNFTVLDIPEVGTEWMQFKIELKNLIELDEIQISYQPNLKIDY